MVCLKLKYESHLFAISFSMSTVKVAGPSVRRLIVGLGNTGSEFHRTRHNVGFAVCRLFASEYLPKMSSSGQKQEWKLNKGSKCYLLQDSIDFNQESLLGLDLVDNVSERAKEKTKTNT